MNDQHIGYIRASTFEQNTDQQLDGIDYPVEHSLSGTGSSGANCAWTDVR